MPNDPYLRWLFLANATVLIAHQIDAAYWHEWNMFRIPGGNQMNLFLNIPIIALLFYAHSAVVARTPNSLGWYKLIAGLGFLTVAIHAFFFFQGHEEFMQPMSIALLVATLVLSIGQLLVVGSNGAVQRD